MNLGLLTKTVKRLHATTPMPLSVRRSVARRVHEKHPHRTHAEIERAIDRMLAFLANPGPDGAPPSELVDDCWHEFILHTPDYMTWCEDNFGHYIHHVPNLNYRGKLKCDAGCTNDSNCKFDPDPVPLPIPDPPQPPNVARVGQFTFFIR